ncbi:MAG TPA: hypothetical protein VNH63_05000, partial [Gemmatimonadales bacterium]|nr:hypothetical protein [Gemmatimonadales bacterium]
GWKFSFSGNVNVFAVFSADANSGQKNFNIRTGLLPGFVVFDAKGHEGNYDLGVHVGFAPQIQNAGQEHDALAQIDMRQLYLTVGMKNGGTLLAGRELGVFQRQNILNDMTLYGTGALGPVQGGGTTLGRIGYGYTYPNFNAQITYSTSAAKPTQITIGLFQPSVTPNNGFTVLPRVEAELTHSMKRGGGKNASLWVGGELQNTKSAPTGGTSLTAIGVAGGIRADLTPTLNLTVAAYYTKGVGSTFQFGSGGDGEADATHGRPAMGGYAQLLYKMNPTTQLGASWGISELKGASTDPTTGELGQFSSYTVGWYHNMTKSLKTVVEGTREINDLGGLIAFPAGGNNRTDVSAGLMLFF